ncbi:MAG: serine/threonine protein kinase [Planctomyces sp.]|nr:serine/threonine protein kinase [Planctomyces sp.]
MTPTEEDSKPTLIRDVPGQPIDLEAETVLFEQTMPNQGPVRMVEGSAVSFRSATVSLLQWRLRAILVLALVVNIGLVILTLFNSAEFITGGYEHYYVFAILRMGILGGLLAILWAYDHFTLPQLRSLEGVIFGFIIVMWILQRYSSVISAAETSSEVILLANRFNGLISLIFIILSFGMLIPHRWQETAKAVFTMGLAPLAVTILIWLFHPELMKDIRELNSPEHMGSLILNLIIACALATYGAGVLNYMRERIHEAEQYGQYRLLRKIGEGGMGEVHLAEHALLKRPCALKLIRTDSEHDEIAIARFEREVRTTAGLTHPHTIEIYDYGHTDDGVFYYVMEFLPGMSLADLVDVHGTLSTSRALHLLDQTCDALIEAHGAGLIHRDLKPDNLFVSERGGVCDFVKVLDFGLVRQTNPDASDATAENVISGTPRYMAPEQVMGEPNLDARCDIYALGCIAYFTLTGRTPFTEESVMADMIAHTNKEVIPPSRHADGISPELEAVILKCLEKKKEDRFASVFDLQQALRDCPGYGDWDSRQAAVWWEEQETDVVTS